MTQAFRPSAPRCFCRCSYAMRFRRSTRTASTWRGSMLADFLDMESSVLVNLHVQSVDQVNAIKTVKRKITDLDKSKIEEQKKAVRAGYDMDISATRS